MALIIHGFPNDIAALRVSLINLDFFIANDIIFCSLNGLGNIRTDHED